MADQCMNERFKKMLPLYEFDLLSDEQRREFELHLMECDYCLNSVQAFKNVSKHIRFNPRVSETMDEIVKADKDSGKSAEKKQIRLNLISRLKRSFIPASLVTVLFLIFLLLKPWKFEFEVDQEAIASENLIAIMYFNDLTDQSDSQRFGEIVTSLLITDLSESNYLRVVSSQQLYDILSLIGKEDTKTIDRDIASQVARQAQARWMITGDILQTEPNIILASQLVEVSTGKVVSSERFAGEPDESIFSLVDKLSAKIKHGLSLPEIAYREPDNVISHSTTNSTEAYRYYLEGIEFYNQFYWNDAIRSFENALMYDSTFAMVYYYLSELYRGPQAIEAIADAKKYSEKVGRKEKYLIDIQEAMLQNDIELATDYLQKLIEHYPGEKYAHYLIGNIYRDQFNTDSAIFHFNKAIEIDPLYKNVYNVLAYLYADRNDVERAIEMINKYIELAPNEANPYDSKGEIFARFGKIDEAIVAYKKALEMKPDFHNALINLANLYLYKRDYEEADSCYTLYAAIDKSTELLQLKIYAANVLLFQGKFGQALEELNEGIEYAKENTEQRWEDGLGGLMRLVKLRVLKEQGITESLMADIENCEEIKSDYHSTNYSSYLILYIEMLSQSGRYSEAEAAAKKLKEYLDENNQILKPYWYCRGYIEFARENWDVAKSYFVDAAENNNDFLISFRLAQTYLEMSDFEFASVTLEKLISDYRFWRDWIWMNPKTRYYLAYAYDQGGDLNSAVEHYEAFLDICKDADSGFKEIDDAKERLNHLKSRI